MTLLVFILGLWAGTLLGLVIAANLQLNAELRTGEPEHRALWEIAKAVVFWLK